MDTSPKTESSTQTSSSDSTHDDHLMRMRVKSEKVDVATARLVSKSFALRCLKKAWPSARIQVLKKPPQAILDGYKLDEHPDFQVWQVHAGGRGIEVVGPLEVLPYTAVREAFRCIAQMHVTFEPVKGTKLGIRFDAWPIPVPKPETPEKAVLVHPDLSSAELAAVAQSIAEVEDGS